MKKIILVILMLLCSVSIVGACENTINSTLENNTTITIIVDENNITYPTIDEEEVRNNLTSFVDDEIVKNVTIEPSLNETGVAVYEGIRELNSTEIHDDTENVGELATGNPITSFIVAFFILILFLWLWRDELK